MTDEDYMQMAIRKTQEGIAAGQSPFGSVIVNKDGRVIAATHNSVWRTCDPTAHAEMNCIRQATSVLKTIALPGCALFSTTEPCPMCLAASHWAKLERVVFGATIADAAAAGFNELHFDAKQLAETGKSHLRVEGGLLREECKALFAQWKKAGLSKAY
jgi:tRNA(Arg) A34 adenosine deaminase TadA